MGLLKRKEERSETISLRVPRSMKAELDELRRRADAAGFDLTATITESLIRLAKQVRSELDGCRGRTKGAGRMINGSSTTPAQSADGKAV